MFERMDRSWDLVKASASILMKNQLLLIFPLISGVPVLAARDVGPFEAVKESAELFKSTWGESFIVQAGLGLAFSLIYSGVAICGVVLVVMAAAPHGVPLIVMTTIVAIGAMVITTLIHAALSGIYAAALYRYAADTQGTQGFDSRALGKAFLPAG